MIPLATMFEKYLECYTRLSRKNSCRIPLPQQTTFAKEVLEHSTGSLAIQSTKDIIEESNPRF